MKRRGSIQQLIVWTLLAAGALAGGARATLAAPPAGFDRNNPHGRQLVVRVTSTELDPVAAQFGLTVLAHEPRGADVLAVVETTVGTTAEQAAAWLAGDGRVRAVETQLTTALPAPPRLTGGSAGAVSGDLLRTGTSAPAACPHIASTALWSGYVEQEAASKIALDAAQQAAGCGSALVAVIDTGVDPSHPVLAGVLTAGYDFLDEQNAVASEWNQLDQSVIPIVEEIFSTLLYPTEQATLEGRGELLMLDAGIAPILDQDSSATIAGQNLPTYFGHGTMVAGLVHLAAPAARIMPLRVFDGEGRAHLFDVVRAIYYAVDQGADVISMSFTLASSSLELERAVRYARDRGVVCVAAAGNDGERTRVFPAALGEVVGVASTDLDDTLSEFSNHGSALVTLAAPGGGVISTYPGGLYAAGWGTSFAAPLVSGTVALLGGGESTSVSTQLQSLINALKQGAVKLDGLEGAIGSGRLDALGAVVAAGW